MIPQTLDEEVHPMLENLDWHPRRRYCDACCRSSINPYCRNWPVPGKTRCRFHGGLSTGPRTSGGKARAVAAMVEGRRRWVERMKAAGTKFPGGRKAGVRWTTPAMRAQAVGEQAPRRGADFPAGLRVERDRAASKALDAAFSSKAQRRAAIRAMSPQDKIQAARHAIEVLMERFNRTGSLYP
jgi:hypothetical protein